MTIKASSRSVPEVEHSAASALAASDRRLRNEVRGGYQSGLGVIRSLSDSGACRTSALTSDQCGGNMADFIHR